MQFSVIYSFDVPQEFTVTDLQPPHHRKIWNLTESYTEDGYKHRKYAALLTKKQFLEFKDELDLRFESDTMGMIGAPGFGIAHLPAVNLSNDDHVSAYVCPVPDCGSKLYEKPDLLGRYVERAFNVLRKH